MFIVTRKKFEELEKQRRNDIIKLSKERGEIFKLYDGIVKELDDKNKHLMAENKKMSSTCGGLTSGNNKYKKKTSDLLTALKEAEKELKKEQQISLSKQNTIDVLTKENEELVEQKAKLQGIVDNLNKLISKELRPRPTATNIINYDKKDPIRK